MDKDVLLMLLNIESLLGGKGEVEADTPKSVAKKIDALEDFAASYMKAPTGKVPKGRLSIKDFRRIKERLTQPMDETKLNQFLDKLPKGIDPDDAAAAIAEVMPKIKSQIPVNSSVTLTGLDERDPSDYEKSKFIRTVQILENPLSILPLIESDAVTGTEIDALKLFYPSVYEALKMAFVSAIAGLAGKNAEDKPASIPMRKNRTISLLLDVPRVSPEQMALFQKSGTSEGDKAEMKSNSEQTLTDTQRVATNA